MGVDIESYCKRAFDDDEFVAECNWFVWRVASECCRKYIFGEEKDSVSADGMIELMRAAGARKHLGWTFPSARWKEIGYWYRSPVAQPRSRRRKRLSTRR